MSVRPWLLAAFFSALGLLSCNLAWGQPAGTGWVQCANGVCSGAAQEGLSWQFASFEREFGVCSDVLIESGDLVTPGYPLAESRTFECATDASYSTWVPDSGASIWMRGLYVSTDPPGTDPTEAEMAQDLMELWGLGLMALLLIYLTREFILRQFLGNH